MGDLDMKPLRIGLATIYAWRPHVEHAYFLAKLAKKAGHEIFFLACDGDLSACYTHEMRDRPAWQECLQCRAGGIRSYSQRNVVSIRDCVSRGTEQVPREWVHSSASTLGRFESDADYASSEFETIAARLYPAVQLGYETARAWILSQRLDAVCVFNGRMDITRAIYEAAKSLNVRVLSMERTWFGNGLQLYPEENCLGLRSVDRLITDWRDVPLTRQQATLAASYVAKRFLRQNQKEWRAYNLNARNTAWPIAGGKRRILLIPSSRNEVWGHPDWVSGWPDPLDAYDALIDHLNLTPSDLLLRCHPNWSEKIGRAGGEHSERLYTTWAEKRGIHCIASADNISTLGLIEQCDAIVVANGSAALEAGILGKQVIGTASSFYQQAGFRDSACTPEQLFELKLHADLKETERKCLREEIPRLTLRFVYTMVQRVSQYTQFVRAETTTKFKYDMSADPQRFIDLLRSGELRADDETYATGPQEESEVLAQIAAKDWQGLIDAIEPDTRNYAPLKRRLLFQPIDMIRDWMPLGDR